jgi:hypothetical protein
MVKNGVHLAMDICSGHKYPGCHVRMPETSKQLGGLSRMAKRILIFLLLVVVAQAPAQNNKPVTLRDVLLSELRSTHTTAEWFAPANVAVKGLTAEQASWSDGKGNHSVGQLAHHIVFWNRQNLARLKGEQPEKFGGNNDERPSTNLTPRLGK